jgi:DNA-binding transcriptional ArsR family regulator
MAAARLPAAAARTAAAPTRTAAPAARPTAAPTRTAAPAAFQVLAEPSRRRILDLLRTDERSVNDLVERLPLSQPGVSRHLKVLREAGLVKVKKQAQRRLYAVNPEPLAEIDEWLAPFRALWEDKLDALEAYLDREDQT